MTLRDIASGAVFNAVHRNNLVYNTCWEDPRLDRVALELGPDDAVMMITSAGCNALDYALCSPREIHCVDMNPRQNALLELKLAGIRTLEFDTFFDWFGRGRVIGADAIYGKRLRPELSPASRKFWDDHIHFFSAANPRDSFYFHGTSGFVARMLNLYVDRRPGMRESVNALLEAETLEEQQNIFYTRVVDMFWSKPIRWIASKDSMLSLLGVPKAQRDYLEQHYAGGIVKFMEDCFEAVFAKLPLGDNYFWRVYLTGQYTHDCCPEYLKRENFEALKGGLAGRVHVHTNTIENFLRGHDGRFTRYVLLDHMDWLSSHRIDALRTEWQAIVDRAAPQSRIIWRSGGMQVDFVDPIEVSLNKQRQRIGDMLTYHPELAADLHVRDRVHTYGSFYIADMATA